MINFQIFCSFLEIPDLSDAAGYRNAHLLVHKGKTGGKNRFASFRGYVKHKII